MPIPQPTPRAIIGLFFPMPGNALLFAAWEASFMAGDPAPRKQR